jgi:2-dehydro-3-deoxyphosphogalactonate aldolase
MKTPLVTEFLLDLAPAPLIAILRGVTPEAVLPACDALAAGGVRFLEVTLNSPDALTSIGRAAAHFRGSGVWIGAGTVLTPAEVDAVAAAGGRYIISPNMEPAVIRRTRERGLVSIPGFFTASEAFAALAAGADLLKCFPVGRLGPGYIKDLKAVLPAPVIAVGGVDEENAYEYLAHGAVAVGVGASLYKAGKPPAELSRAAAAFMARAKPACTPLGPSLGACAL